MPPLSLGGRAGMCCGSDKDGRPIPRKTRHRPTATRGRQSNAIAWNRWRSPFTVTSGVDNSLTAVGSDRPNVVANAGLDDPTPDGRWEVTEYARAPYRTRLLVLRPARADDFNGTVVVGWQNVSAGYESSAPASGEVYEGYAWVGVSAQEVGLYGFPTGMERMASRPVLVPKSSTKLLWHTKPKSCASL